MQTTNKMREYIIRVVLDCDNMQFIELLYYRVRNLQKILHLQ